MADNTQSLRTANPPESYGGRPQQAIKDFEALYTQAGDPRTEKELANRGEMISAKFREKFPGLFDDVSFSEGDLKGWDRSARKLLGDKGNALDHQKVPDVVDLRRGRIVIENADQVKAVREILSDDKLRSELGIEYAHDRFANPSPTHYRDINMSVRLPNGHVAEIQISQRDMLAAAEFTHDPYEDADALRKRASIEGREPSESERYQRKVLTSYAQQAFVLDC
jgi:hypothetical protein